MDDADLLVFVLEEVLALGFDTDVDANDTMLFVVGRELLVILNDVVVPLLDSSGVVSEEDIRLVADSGKILVSM